MATPRPGKTKKFKFKNDCAEALDIVQNMKWGELTRLRSSNSKNGDIAYGRSYQLDGVNAVLDAAETGDSSPAGEPLDRGSSKAKTSFALKKVEKTPEIFGIKCNSPAYWSLLSLGGALWLQDSSILTMAGLATFGMAASVASKTAEHGGHLREGAPESAFNEAKVELLKALNGDDDEEAKDCCIEKVVQKAKKEAEAETWKDYTPYEGYAEDWNKHIAVLRVCCPQQMARLAQVLATSLAKVPCGKNAHGHAVSAVDIIRQVPEWRELFACPAPKDCNLSELAGKQYVQAAQEEGLNTPTANKKKDYGAHGRPSSLYAPVSCPKRFLRTERLRKCTHQYLKQGKLFDCRWDVYMDLMTDDADKFAWL